MHDVFNAFQVLTNDGFLHDQGVLTLEADQKFYEEISEQPEEATLVQEKFTDFCRSMRNVRPVVTLKMKSLNEKLDNSVNQEYYHAVTLERSVVGDGSVTMTFKPYWSLEGPLSSG